MSSAPIGIVAEQQAKREGLVSRLSPAARHRHFPRIYAKPHHDAKETRITVDCRTGTRTIETVVRVPVVLAPPPPRPVRLSTDAQIVNVTRAVVEELWSVSRSSLLSRSRRTGDGERHAVYRLLRRVHGWSTTRIGKLLDRDHTSVITGLQRARDMYQNHQPWREKFDAAMVRLVAMKKEAGQ